MILKVADFNASDALLRDTYAQEWEDLAAALEVTPLHLKASDQAGKQGSPIFDPVGTNAFVAARLRERDWLVGIGIPDEMTFLGKHLDLVKRGVFAEVQFSNYPFLLNNLLRFELLQKAGTRLGGSTCDMGIIVTKAGMLPASNSTLYYEQAVQQVSALADHGVFDVALRVVGLFPGVGEEIDVTWTDYENPRYSRTVVDRGSRRCVITPTGAGCSIRFVD